jgi:hypothetical protein
MRLLDRFRSLFSRDSDRSPVDQKSTLVFTERHFDLPDDLVRELAAFRASRAHVDQLEVEHDAFLLDPGLGPATYLTRDGRVLWDDDGWGVKATRGYAYVAIMAGVDKTGIGLLRDLLPKRVADAEDCLKCDTTGRFTAHGQLVDVHGKPFLVVCTACWGLGWISRSLDTSLSTRWAG